MWAGRSSGLKHQNPSVSLGVGVWSWKEGTEDASVCVYPHFGSVGYTWGGVSWGEHLGV